MSVRVCPECEEEYRPDIAVCADCGADLVDADEDGTPPEKDPVPVTPGVRAAPLYSGPPAGLRPLAEALVASEVPFQLVPEERVSAAREGARLILVVPETDAARALDALADFRGRGTDLGITELAATWGDGHEGGDAPPCPACGGDVPADASACPECGLELGGAAE